jgi:hypothetical protein
MGKISEESWEKGISLGNGEKEGKILEVLGKIGKMGIDVEGVREESGIKWVWGSLVKLNVEGKVEVKKIGKKNYYRIKK